MEDLNLAFSGAGFLGIYHIGVVSCLKFYGKKLLEEIECFGGSSAGALTACMLLCDMDLEASVQFVMHLASKVHGKILGPFSPEFEPCETIRKTYMTYLPPDAYKRATGKLFISLTRVSDWENVIVSNFENNKELVDALVCTSFIPFFSGVLPPKFKGVSYIDGGFTDNLPQHFTGTTITVSPFSGESDICPADTHKSESYFDMRNTSILVTSHNIYRMSRALFPPGNEILSDMCRQGYRDTLKYLHGNYPDKLSFDVTIVSIPRCCESAYGNSSDDEYSQCSCCGNTTTGFSDIEHDLAKKKMIDNLVVVPEQLNKILLQTKVLFQQSDLCWYLLRAVSNIAQWLIKPCYYAIEHVHTFVTEIFHYLLPKIKQLSEYNFYTKKGFSIALQVIEAYHDTIEYQWHPSIDEKKHDDFKKTKRRILTAQQSLVSLPLLAQNHTISEFENLSEPVRKLSGINAPPPSRVSSFGRIGDFDVLSKLNEVVFDDAFSEMSSDAILADEDEIVLEEDMLCMKDDDGLIMKLDRTSSACNGDDYGSELQIIPDPVYDALVIGSSDGALRKRVMTNDYEWDDFIEINGIDN